MTKELLQKIDEMDVDTIIFDIDGTLKDLVREHDAALTLATGFICSKKGKNIRRKLIFSLDKIAMWFVKTGVLPTNKIMQNILLSAYAIILFEKPQKFKEIYNKYYSRKVIFFREAQSIFNKLCRRKEVYFITVNKQNYNIENLSMPKEKIIYIRENKCKAYKELISTRNLAMNTTLIVGDNIIDDILPARKIGVKYLLVDNYNCGFKCFVAKLLNIGM